MTEKRETSQGYIIRILQHFATKLRNITNFVMLYQAVIKSRANGADRRSGRNPGTRVLIPPGYLHPGKRKH
jgi:hypothetical protein